MCVTTRSRPTRRCWHSTRRLSTFSSRTPPGTRRRRGRAPELPDTPYADWLIAIFDRWYREPRTAIRLFEEIITLILTGRSSGEVVGLAPSTVVVVETDGSIEQIDSLK